MQRFLWLFALGLLSGLVLLAPPCWGLAFPTAEGYGANSVGGRGGQVLEVTTLADCNVAGCFRWAVTQSFPRTIVFRVSGTIVMESVIQVTSPYLTIAGQTSPGGIQLRWATPPIDGHTVTGGDSGESGLQFLDGSHNIIIRHMHLRGGGYYPGDGNQNLLFYNSSGGPTTAPHDIIVDHVTDMWTADASPSPYGNNVDNVTIQWSLVAEGGNLCDPPNVGQTCPASSKGPHVGGPGTSTMHVSVHHNALISNGIRNPLIQGATNFDLVNNFIYNWGGNNATELGSFQNNATAVGNLVNNVYVKGPGSSAPVVWLSNAMSGTACGSAGTTRVDGSAADFGGTRVYSSGNWGPSRDGSLTCMSGCVDDFVLYGSLDWYYSGVDGSCFPAPPSSARLGSPITVPAITTHPTSQVESVVLANVGATKPARDSIDTRVISAAQARTACNLFTPGCVSVTGGNSAADWAIYSSPMAPTDTDHDGIPDTWETAHGLNPNSATDGATLTASGYSNLELYLNELAGDTVSPGPSCNPTWAPANALDGVPGTAWHTQFSGSAPAHPHELQVNMQGTYQVAGFRYLPRAGPDTSGRITQYEFYTSVDGTNWGTAAATGTWPNSAAEQEVLFAPRMAQYVRLRSLAGIGGAPYASVDELNVLQATGGGTGTLSGTVTRAAVGGRATFTDLQITAGGSYMLQATASGLTPATSSAFTITSTANHLAFLGQPTTVLPGQPFPSITVRFLDGANNVFPTTQAVNMTLTGCTGVTLAGTVSRAAVAGVATFTDLSIATAATGCTLVASATDMAPVTSSPFNVISNPFLITEWLANGVSGHYCAQTGGDTNLSGAQPGVDYQHNLGCAIPAALLQAGALLQSCALIDVVTGGTGTRPVFKLTLGGQTLAANLLSGTAPSLTTNAWVCFTTVVSQAPGPAVPLYTSFEAEPPSFPQYSSPPNQTVQPVIINTAVDLPLAFATQWQTAGNGTNSITLHGMIVGLAQVDVVP